jgi:ABC-type antimicrobial peptide transport system permease subunit
VLDETPGVQHDEVQRSYSMSLLSVQEGGTVLTPDDLRQRLQSVRENMAFGPDGGDGSETDLFSILSSSLGNVGAKDVNGPLPDNSLQEGRQLTPNDAGQPVMVVDGSTFTNAAGISVGDKLTFQINAGASNPLAGGGGSASSDLPTVTFEVVGVTRQAGIGGFETQNYAPADAFPADVEPSATTIVAQVDKEQIPELRRTLSGTLGVFVIDNAALTRLISSLLGTFTAFPTMVAALGLIVGGVVIANSVALTTMERRREIAVMKSVGLQRERVLFMILLENGILGLIGGLIGVGIGLVALVSLLGVTGAPGSAIPVGAALGLMLLCVLVALVAAVSTAWGASGEKPLNVLRYE